MRMQMNISARRTIRGSRYYNRIVFIINNNEGGPAGTRREVEEEVKNYSMYQLVGATIIFAVSRQ